MSNVRIWFDTALGFIALFATMALMGFAAGYAIGGYGFVCAMLSSALTLAILVVSTIRKPMWIHEMLVESYAVKAKQDRKRSLALIGEVKGDHRLDSNQVYLLVALVSLLLSFAKELNQVFFVVAMVILTKKLVSPSRVPTTLIKRSLGLLVAPAYLGALCYLSFSGRFDLDGSVLVLLSTIVLLSVADEGYVLWKDLRRAKKLKAQIELLYAIQAMICQRYA